MRRVLLAHRAQLVHRVLQVCLAQQVPRATLVLLDCLEHLANPVQLEHQVLQAL